MSPHVPSACPSTRNAAGRREENREEGANPTDESSEPVPNRHQRNRVRQRHWSAAGHPPPPTRPPASPSPAQLLPRRSTREHTKCHHSSHHGWEHTKCHHSSAPPVRLPLPLARAAEGGRCREPGDSPSATAPAASPCSRLSCGPCDGRGVKWLPSAGLKWFDLRAQGPWCPPKSPSARAGGSLGRRQRCHMLDGGGGCIRACGGCHHHAHG